MSWLFGKKKVHKESPTDSVEEEQPVDQGDDFIFVEKRDKPSVEDGSAEGFLYPSLPTGIPPYPVSTKQSGSSENQQDMHPLNGVPFKLCKELQNLIGDDIVIDKLRLNEILSFLKRIEDTDLTYDFSLENSIVTEMNNQSGD